MGKTGSSTFNPSTEEDFEKVFSFLSYNRDGRYYWHKEGVEGERNTNGSGSSGIADAFNPDDSRRSEEDDRGPGGRGVSEEERRMLNTHPKTDSSVHVGSLDSGIGILQGAGLDRKVPGYHHVEDGKVLDSIINAGFGPIGNHFDMNNFYPAASSDSDSESLSG